MDEEELEILFLKKNQQRKCMAFVQHQDRRSLNKSWRMSLVRRSTNKRMNSFSLDVWRRNFRRDQVHSQSIQVCHRIFGFGGLIRGGYRRGLVSSDCLQMSTTRKVSMVHISGDTLPFPNMRLDGGALDNQRNWFVLEDLDFLLLLNPTGNILTLVLLHGD